MKKKLRVGPRIYKTGIASGIALFISQTLHTRSPFFAIIAAVIVLQPTVYETVKKSKERIFGTLVGIIVGMIFALIAPLNPIGEALGIISVLLICNIFRWRGACVIACIAFAYMTVRVDSIVIDAIHRIIDTLIGIGVAIGVNYIFKGAPLEHQIDKYLMEIMDKVIFLYRKSIIGYIKNDIKSTDLDKIQIEIETLFSKAYALKQDYKQELHYKSNKIDRADEFDTVYEGLRETYEHVTSLCSGIKHTHPVLFKEDILDDVEQLIDELPSFHNTLIQTFNSQEKIDEDQFEQIEGKIQSIQEKIKEEKYQLLNQISLNDSMYFINLLYNTKEIIGSLKTLQNKRKDFIVL